VEAAAQVAVRDAAALEKNGYKIPLVRSPDLVPGEFGGRGN
jgi:hypothetical protein